MKKRNRKKGDKWFLWFMILIIIFLLVLVIKFFNEPILKEVENLKGELGESKLGVGAGLKNSPPDVDFWETPLENGNPPIPIENSIKPVKFIVTASDKNGYADITGPGSSVTAKFINLNNGPIVSEQERATSSNCVYKTNTQKSATFECTVDMQYWDEPGTDKWTIQVNIQDIKAGVDTKSSKPGSNYPFFSYGTLLGMATDKISISFSDINIDSKNIASGENPVTVKNTGNIPVTASGTSWIKVTGKNLIGQATTNVMNVSSFAVNDINDCVNNFESLTDLTPVQVNGANYSRRPNDDISGAGKRELFFCIGNQISPSILPEDYYSTTTGNEWIIEVSQ